LQIERKNRNAPDQAKAEGNGKQAEKNPADGSPFWRAALWSGHFHRSPLFRPRESAGKADLPKSLIFLLIAVIESVLFNIPE
jgi:hypothetical protein